MAARAHALERGQRAIEAEDAHQDDSDPLVEGPRDALGTQGFLGFPEQSEYGLAKRPHCARPAACVPIRCQDGHAWKGLMFRRVALETDRRPRRPVRTPAGRAPGILSRGLLAPENQRQISSDWPTSTARNCSIETGCHVPS
jgi:hypothetical protein